MSTTTGTAPRRVVKQVQPATVRHDDLVGRRHTGAGDRLVVADVIDLLPSLPFWNDLSKWRKAEREHGTRLVLDWLAAHPGEGWQHRWSLSGVETDKGWQDRIAESASAGGLTVQTLRYRVLLGAGTLLLLRVVVPSYDFLCRFTSRTLFQRVEQCRSPQLFAQVRRFAVEQQMPDHLVSIAITSLAKIVLHTGRELDELTSEDVLEFRAQRPRSGDRTPKGLHTAWKLLAHLGRVPDTTLAVSLRRPQMSTEDMVDAYQLRCRDVRDVLVRYLNERRAAMDYSSFRALVRQLAGLFWADLEVHHPGISSLHLPAEVAEAWRSRMAVVVTQDGTVRPRKQRFDVMLRVRAFYLDIQEWALADPSWAPWAVPSPVRKQHTEGQHKVIKQTMSEMHQRVRERLPHLPVLVDVAERHLAVQGALLAAAVATKVDEVFDHDGAKYRRTQRKSSQRHPGPDLVLIENLSTGKTTDVLHAEADAFWSWAVIEILRHTGVRIEELLELTQVALVSYRLPSTDEIIPLLQIVPSKSNEERLLVVSPELASVLATVVTRLRAHNDGAIPLVARYDHHERVLGPALPHLLQSKVHGRDAVISPKTVANMLARTLARSGLRDAAGRPLHYTPHDFRRMFSTETVTGGLPIHIAARLLGHQSLATTQRYMAVFQEDLVIAYRAFLEQRRALRPAAEYREPTEDEWLEFQQHFELRKVELGECGRPYGTPCKHEHACVRCPMLRVDPRQRERLTEIIRNLAARIDEAKVNGWLGEVEGLQVSLTAAEAKLVSVNRAGRTNTMLGIPVVGRRP